MNMVARKIPTKKNHKKAKSAEPKGKRYRCSVCKKKSPKKIKNVPYYCSNCVDHKNDDNIERDKVREARDRKIRK